LRVTVTDNDATRFFSGIFMSGPHDLSRSAEAEYNLPLPLGSPLNFFGGDRTKTQAAPAFSWSVNWPSDHQSRPPTNAGTSGNGCNVGTSSVQNLGKWNAGSPPTWNPTGFTSGAPQCVWTVLGADSGGPATTFPPPDHHTRQPTNSGGSGCIVRTDGTGTVIGRWVGATFTAGAFGSPSTVCTFRVMNDAPGAVPAFSNSLPPSNQPCRVSYVTANGWWSSGSFRTTSVPSGGATTTGNQLCRWQAGLTSVDVSPPNPIDPARSPGFWAQIHGPGADQQSGDAYSTRCTTTTNCGSPNNSLYINPSDPNQGYWYVIKAPPGGGQVVLRVFDAQLTPGPLSAGTGDSSITGTASFTTTFRVYHQTNALDFTSRTPVGAASANQTAGSCNWAIEGEASFRLAWTDLCTVTMNANDVYLVNVRTATNASTNSAGRNGYALEACLVSSCTTGPQPAIHAFERMVLYNNIDSGDATFYIAEVAPQYAGKTLVLEMFDPGESSGDAWVYPMLPSSTSPGPVVHASPGMCDFASTRSGYPQAGQTNNGGFCSFQSAASGALYNGHWFTMRIRIPDDYTCTPGTNPVTAAGSCWWGIRYTFSGGGSPTDTTTWRARIEGNPLRLTQ
jgi:hypothetical protein